MLINGKMSYFELEQLIYVLKNNLVGSFLKKIYHHNNLWLFKFNYISLIYQPGVALWVGSFDEREKNLHSISIKLRKEVGDKKLVDIDMVDNDRTVILQFYNHKIVLELYAKGNIILLNNEDKIMVLTRIYENCSHNLTYQIKPYKIYEDYQLVTFGWKITNKEIKENLKDFENVFVALENLWKIKYQQQKTLEKKIISKKKNKKFSVEDNIMNQVNKYQQKIDKKMEAINKHENVDYQNIDYKELEKLYQEKKLMDKKLTKATDVLENKEKIKPKKQPIPKTKLKTDLWYHKYHWWYTKNNFLVVGGKSASDNEKLVKSYLNDEDLYFHSEDPGSGSFILFTDKSKPDVTDIDETAEGVLALSNQWNLANSGKVFYVNGNQVSKSAPTGEYVGKGSFMIYGKKEFVNVHNFMLGYCIYQNQLMLAPYRTISRFSNNNIKLKPRNDIKKMRGKLISDAIKKKFNVILDDNIHIFNKPSTIMK